MEQDFKNLMELQNKIESVKKEQQIARARVIYVITEFVFGIVGLIIIIYALGWLASLGLFLMFWSNNLITQRNHYQNDNYYLKTIWKSKK